MGDHEAMHRIAGALSLALLGVWLNGACASSRGPADARLTFSEVKIPGGKNSFPNWPLPPYALENRLATEEFEIRSSTGAGGGTTGARKMKLFFPADGTELTVKWKKMPSHRLDGFNNSPRKEFAAYAIQTVLLDPADYVVPTSLARCIPLAVIREHDSRATASIAGIHCQLGLFSVWMQDVSVPDELYDESRFLEDGAYTYFMANLNLLTYVIGHRDGRSGNFLVAKNDGRRQVFAVDNGISFGAWVYNYFVPNWNDIRVAALRKDSVERLRRLRRKDLDFLGELVHLEADDDGVLWPKAQRGNLDPDDGVRVRGTTVQLGLTKDEIDDVYERIQELLEEVDEGKIAVF